MNFPSIRVSQRVRAGIDNPHQKAYHAYESMSMLTKAQPVAGIAPRACVSYSQDMGKRKGRKNPAAVALVARRHKKLTPERRSEIARLAARARWAKRRKGA